MIAYLDASAALRQLLKSPGALPRWGAWDRAVSSALLEVEASCTFLRLRRQGALDDEGMSRAFQALGILLEGVTVVPVTAEVLRRASQPFPVALRSLDALHMATAALWADEHPEPLTVLTHDEELDRAARAMGFRTASPV